MTASDPPRELAASPLSIMRASLLNPAASAGVIVVANRESELSSRAVSLLETSAPDNKPSTPRSLTSH